MNWLTALLDLINIPNMHDGSFPECSKSITSYKKNNSIRYLTYTEQKLPLHCFIVTQIMYTEFLYNPFT